MTLMKSILLGSAAGVVAVAGAQAADLPTRKAAPAEYVKICNVGGMAGFVIPGSDTCLKISGYVTAQIEGGNTKTGYFWRTSPAGTPSVGLVKGAIAIVPAAKAVVRGTTLVSRKSELNPSFGWTTRANIDFDARSMTSYGVLRGYAEIQFEQGNGFDNTGNGAYINLAYVQWAGITAGRAPSFFSFYGGGEAWANLVSPDQTGSNQPDLMAYTATFGGGFSATLAIQSSGAGTGGGTNYNINTTNFGMTAPDVVANVRVDQSWGSAQIGGVAHQVHVYTNDLGAAGPSENKWGWAVGGGVSFNLPSFGAGDKLAFQADYSKNAIWFSGIPDAMWGEAGAAVPLGGVNGNGLGPSVGDTYFAGKTKGGAAVWATPTAWSVSGTFEHHFSPQFSVDPEAAYAQLNWSNSLGQLPSNTTIWLAGAAAHWDPVVNIDFEMELLYEQTNQSAPGLYKAAAGTIDGRRAAFPGNANNGFAGRFEITRAF
jgi:Porin subfamily